METWIKRLLDEVRPFLASRGGPVAMWQVENELSGGDDDTVHYAEWALRTAVELTPDDIVTFCNNSGSPTLSDDYGGSVVFTGLAAATRSASSMSGGSTRTSPRSGLR